VRKKPLSSFTQEEFLKAVEEVRELILSGEAIQVVLGQMFKVRSPRDPFSVYRHLRRINPSPYLLFIDFDSYVLLGSSPEVMVRLKDGKLKTKPIAGTRPRTGDPQRDKELVEELLKDPKEAAEHVMLVDLARNDLGRVSKIGSVKVTRFKTVEAYSHVFHLVSEVEGELKEGCDALDVIKATFPAGTLSGAPKVRAMQIISEKEPVRRGFYGGAVGYLDFNGNADTAIAIRCVLYKDGVYYLGAGAGIVADSMPEREYEECLHKASGLFEALGVTRP
jgi:anthranilate synthase component 1